MKFVAFHLMPYRPLDLEAAAKYRSAWVVLPNSFYDPEKGSVLLDGRDVKDVGVGWLRRQIGLVAQEPVLLVHIDVCCS